MPPATRDGNSTKARILRTAAQLFANHGYHATGVSLLSDTVGIGRGALYYHIGSKEQLLYEISKAQVDVLIQSSMEIVTSMDPVEKKVRRLARDLIRNIADHNAEWSVFFREISALSPPYRAEVQAARDSYEDLWDQVLREGRGQERFRYVSPVSRKGILGMFNYSYIWIRPDGPLSPEEIADELSDTVLYGIVRDGRVSNPTGS